MEETGEEELDISTQQVDRDLEDCAWERGDIDKILTPQPKYLCRVLPINEIDEEKSNEYLCE